MKETDFVTAQQAKLLAELGFNEPCLTSFDKEGKLMSVFSERINEKAEYKSFEETPLFEYVNNNPGAVGVYEYDLIKGYYAAPLIQQAQDWIESQLFGLCVFRYSFDGEYSFAIFDLGCNVVEDWSEPFYTKQEAVSASIDYYLAVIKEVKES